MQFRSSRDNERFTRAISFSLASRVGAKLKGLKMPPVYPTSFGGKLHCLKLGSRLTLLTGFSMSCHLFLSIIRNLLIAKLNRMQLQTPILRTTPNTRWFWDTPHPTKRKIVPICTLEWQNNTWPKANLTISTQNNYPYLTPKMHQHNIWIYGVTTQTQAPPS